MEIRHFRTFKLIAELKSFTKAAKQLNYGQSTVTEHIQLLERDIGSPLFNRIGKKITVTSVGNELYKYVVELLNIYEKIENISTMDQTIKGLICIGVSESLIIYKFKDILYYMGFEKNTQMLM